MGWRRGGGPRATNARCRPGFVTRRSISRQALASDASRRVAERGLGAPPVILTRLELPSVPLRKDANDEFRLSAVHGGGSYGLKRIKNELFGRSARGGYHEHLRR